MGPTRALLAPDGPHVDPMNLAIRVVYWFVGSKAKASSSKLSTSPSTWHDLCLAPMTGRISRCLEPGNPLQLSMKRNKTLSGNGRNDMVLNYSACQNYLKIMNKIMNVYEKRILCSLTHFPQDKMATISQMIFSVTFCEWKVLYFD